MLFTLSSNLFVNKINGELFLETQLNNTQYLIEHFDVNDTIKYWVDTYSAVWYPDVYEYIGSL